jgi:cyclophilin family peptidyl-prolyl cis-trans isomerase
MDNETKVTYGVIGIIILILGGLAYVLQPMGVDELKKSDTYKEQQEIKEDKKQEIGAQSQTPPSPLATQQSTTTPSMEQKKYTGAVITTNKGTIEFIFGDKTPVTVANFEKLASSQYYDGVRFHRVIKNFMIQTGDPLSKDKANIQSWGTGGPGYTFKDELRGDEQYTLGTVAMANAGPNTNGSQFFIVTAQPGVPLPPNYTVFGKVTKGIETALAIQEVQTGANDRPVDDVIIQKIELR